jgi:hypothetical protein
MAFGLDSFASTVFLCPSMIVTATNAVYSSRVDQSGQASLNLKTSASSFPAHLKELGTSLTEPVDRAFGQWELSLHQIATYICIFTIIY